jgi:hypothetical protein
VLRVFFLLCLIYFRTTDADADVPSKRTKYTLGDHNDDSAAMAVSGSATSAITAAAPDDGEEAEF